MEEFAPQSKATIDLLAKRDHFLAKSNFSSLEEGAMPLVGQWYSDKLKISTMNTYFRKCLTGVEKKKRGPNIQRMLKALAKASASIKPDKALAISEADALMVIKKLKSLGYKLESAAVELQFRTGLRMAEIKYITSEDVIFSNDSIIITVRRGKNIKSSRHIAKARFEHENFFGPPSSTLRHAFSKFQQPFKGLSTGHVNEVIRFVLEAPRHCKTVTTYSFRRLLFRRAFSLCDYDEVRCASRYTLHKNPLMIRAFYDDGNFFEESNK